jgi:YD repeat-containing protein
LTTDPEIARPMPPPNGLLQGRVGVEDGGFNLLTSVDALGNTTTNTYNRIKEILSTTDPLGHVTSTQYDGFGNVVVLHYYKSMAAT